MQAKTALIGQGIPDEMLFDSVEFQVGGLTELSGVRPLKRVFVPRHLVFHTEAKGDPQATVTWNSDGTRQRWSTASGDNLELHFRANMDWREYYSFSVIATPIVEVSGTPRPAEDWMSQYVRPIAEIATLATLRPQAISWVTLWKEQETVPVQMFAVDIAQQPYTAAPPEAAELISRRHATLIRLGPDGTRLPDLLDGWATLRTTYSTFYDYLTVALRDRMSTRSRFLALVPALEGLHVAKYGDGPMPRAEYQKRRRALVDRLTNADGVEQDDVKFIETWLGFYGSYQLADRLHKIVDEELGDKLRDHIKARVEPLPSILKGIVENATDAWAIMGTARNRIAHGADGQPSSAQLAALTRLAHTVAIGAALKHLGVPETVLCDAIDQDMWPVL
jgi:hypothetical protein